MEVKRMTRRQAEEQIRRQVNLMDSKIMEILNSDGKSYLKDVEELDQQFVLLKQALHFI